MERLLDWARSNGAKFEAVPCAHHPRKLYAARDLTPGDVIFSIPQQLLMYGARAYDDNEYGCAFRQLQAEAGPELDQRSLLVLLLVLERCRGQDSFFSPYVDILPDSYDDPFWWPEHTLQLLEGTRLHKAVAQYTSGLQQLHNWLLRLEQLHQQQHLQQQQQGQDRQQDQEQQGQGQQQLQDQQQQQCSPLSTALGGWGLTLEAVKWARSAVWSRAFTVKGLNIGSNCLNPSPADRPRGCSAVHSKAAADVAAAAAAYGAEVAASGAVDGMTSNNISNSSSTAEAEGLAPVIALVPVLDMCDHHPEQRVSWRTVTAGVEQPQQEQQEQQEQRQHQEQHRRQQAFQFTSLSPVAKGSELLNNYGTTKPNEELLLGFGFVLNPNPNDTFLVSISHPQQQQDATGPAAAAAAEGGSELMDGGSGSSDADAAADEAAVWQRRLAAMAALGLNLDVPISVAEPLPGRLLDLLLLAAALPAWALYAMLPQLAANVSASQQQQQQQMHSSGTGLFAAAPLQWQLQALLLLQQQLSAKLRGMKGERLLQQLLHAALPELPGLLGQQAALTEQDLQHSRLAAVYVLSQRGLLRAALTAVTDQVYSCLLLHTGSKEGPVEAAAAAKAAAAGTATSAAAPEMPASSAAAAVGVPVSGMQLHEQLRWCPCCGVLAVAHSKAIPGGSTLLQTPLGCCVPGGSHAELVLHLMLLVVDHLAALEQEQPQGQQQQQHSSAASYFAQQWQRQQSQQGSPCEQVLPWWLVQDNQELVGLLQYTPAGQQMLQASEEHQDDFQGCIQDLQQAAAAGPGPGPDQSSAAGHAELQQQQQQQQRQQRLLQVVQQQPQEAFRMFCWAQQLAAQAAMPLTQAAGGASEAAGPSQQLVIVPGLELMPQVLRQLFSVKACLGAGGNTAEPSQSVAEANGLQQQLQLRPSAAAADTPPSSLRVVRVCAESAIPAASRLGHAALAAGSNAQQLLMEHGPAALHAVAAAAATAAEAATGAAANGLGGNGSVEAGVQAGHALQQELGQLGQAVPNIQSSSSSSSSSQVAAQLQHVYELTLAPPEDDPLRQQKLQLLAATGLGLCHYLAADMQRGGTSNSIGTGYNAGGPGIAQAAAAATVTVAPAGSSSAEAQQHQQQQQQQERFKSVLTAMALCLLLPEHPDHAQLLSNGSVQAVLQSQQQLLQSAGVLSATLGAQSQPAASPVAAAAGAAAAAAGGGVGGEPSAACQSLSGGQASVVVAAGPQTQQAGVSMLAAPAWCHLQDQVLQQTGKAACKQVLQVLKQERKAVRAAQQQLQPLLEGHGGQAATRATDSGPSSAMCSLCCNTAASSQACAAAAGVSVYLQGQLQVLDAWLGSAGAFAGPSSKKSQLEDGEGSRHKKKKKKQ